MLVAILRIFRFFWDIRKTGFYEINSPFVYAPTNKQFVFRSIIYLDADFYNFVPDISKIEAEADEDFYVFYEQCYQNHIQKIHTFLQNMNQGTSFWGHILVIPLLVALNVHVLADVYAWIMQGIVPDFATDFMIFVKTGEAKKELLGLFADILTLTGAFSIRSFLTNIAVKLLIRIGFFTAKVYKKRKTKKSLAKN
jgi:hypothetical protein